MTSGSCPNPFGFVMCAWLRATKELRSHRISMEQTETTTFFTISQSEVELS